MKFNTNCLNGKALDWFVSGIEGDLNHYPEIERIEKFCRMWATTGSYLHYHDSWAASGSVIERDRICINAYLDPKKGWNAHIMVSRTKRFRLNGPTPLIAAMRCFVASRLGDEVELPEELTP